MGLSRRRFTRGVQDGRHRAAGARGIGGGGGASAGGEPQRMAALAALPRALSRRSMGPGLVPSSDRGVPYASRDYTDLLQSQGIQSSRSRKCNRWDNAACESFIKTRKYEEVYRSQYRDLAEARSSPGQFLERIYHRKRLHSALGYVPPAELEAHRAAQKNQGGRCAATFCMSFLRHEEIYPPIRARPLRTAPPTNRLDEFPAGYSLAGCAPAEPASASPAGAYSELQLYCRSSAFHPTATRVLTGCLTPGGKRTGSFMARMTLSYAGRNSAQFAPLVRKAFTF